jgi:type II secretory pathway predicted ATPase ExeA
MAYLEYGLSQGEGFIVITGEVGAGKTTLVRNLFRELAGEKIAAAQIVNSGLDSDDMLRLVAAAFGLPHEDTSKASVLIRLEQFLRQCEQQGKRTLLVVDEAQNLSPSTVEELRMLSNFQTEDRPLLQTFLLGQPISNIGSRPLAGAETPRSVKTPSRVSSNIRPGYPDKSMDCAIDFC